MAELQSLMLLNAKIWSCVVIDSKTDLITDRSND